MSFPTTPVSALDDLVDAARALERAETQQAERLAADRVRGAINAYDATLSRLAAAIRAAGQSAERKT